MTGTVAVAVRIGGRTVHVIPDAAPRTNTYHAVLRSVPDLQVITNCRHEHKGRETAERCAETWLIRAIQE